MKELVEGSVAAFRAAGRLDQHDVTVEVEPVWVEADATRVEQIVTNLVTNALKYTDIGGVVRITVTAENDQALLAVHDDGIGIAREMLPHVFDLFVQGRQSLDRAQGGLGIGLTLVRRLVELQGGTVSAASDGPGHGSVFTVRLPRAPAPHADAPVTTTRPAAPERKLQVLVVEDNGDAREMLRSLLELSGHQVHEAADGPAGVECALRVRPDLALVDLGLPGFDGIEAAARIRAEVGNEVLLVALTGYGQLVDRQRTLQAGFDAHLVKPVAADRLSDVLHRAAERVADHRRRVGTTG